MQPRSHHLTCPPDPLSPDPSRQCIVSLSFLLGSIVDPMESLIMTLLSRLLVDGQASPFYQALIESKLGSRYSPGTGYSSRDTFCTNISHCLFLLLMNIAG
jgi:Zn-dependent M16 (insulinase) family peptidase